MKTQIANEEKYCPMSEATKFVGDFWILLIVGSLLEGEKRFSDLEDDIDGITSSTLSSRLKKLEQEKLVKREQFQCIPPKVIYSLTEKGRGLKKVVAALQEYGNEWYGR